MVLQYHAGEEPWEAVRSSLDDWEAGFYKHWVAPKPEPKASYADLEELKEAEELIRRLHSLCKRAPVLYQTMLTQQVPAALGPILKEVAEVPLNVAGFDGRRLQLTPDVDLVWQHLDLALIRDVMDHVSGRSDEERRKIFQLLLITAPDEPISPIASWYLKRAARLLLYGLEVECVAMCRAVLEAALRYALDEDELDRVGVQRRVPSQSGGEKDFDLAGLIYGAQVLHIFDARDTKRARLIKKYGNDVLHPKDPDRFDRISQEAEPRQRLADLAVLLRRLFPT
jgi:hypothetical protein